MTNAPQKIAENVLLLAVARVSMALSLPMIGLLFWLYSEWRDDKLEAIRTQAVAAQQTATDTSETVTRVSDRLIALETKQVQDTATNDRFQAATLARLDRVQDSIVGLSNAVAALTRPLSTIATDGRRSASDAG